MALDRLRIDSRSTLVALAFCGLAMIYAQDVLSLGKTERIALSLAGMAVLIYVGVNLFSGSDDPSSSPTPLSRIFTAFIAISSIALLVVSRSLTVHSWPHAILAVSGCLLFFVCWSMPKSGWQTVPFMAIYLLTLMGLKWNQFRIFGYIPPTVLIGMAAAWLLISLIVFRILDRRRATTTQLH